MFKIILFAIFFIGEKEVCEDYKFSSTAIESDTSSAKISKKKKRNQGV